MARRPPRGLTDEERALWQKVAKAATPMRRDAPKTDPVEPQPAKRKPVPQPVAPFRMGAKAPQTALPHDILPDLGDRLNDAPVRMDRKAFTRMKRGKLGPEGRIDLHGMTMDQAHPALTRFILGAHSDGKRLVLVITGKGRQAPDDGPIPIRRGILKNQVPQWLSMPPLGPVVLQVTPAHQKHGGGGAYYVYLRRSGNR